MAVKKEVAELLKKNVGLDDAAIAGLHPGLEKFFNSALRMHSNQFVAEVEKSQNCAAQVKVGDRLVFDPFLNPQKSKGIMCPRALLPVLMEISALWEMTDQYPLMPGEKMPEIVFRTIRCLDPGLEDGGVGGVIYRIHAERVPLPAQLTQQA